MSNREFRQINLELDAIRQIELSENIVICRSCTGTGTINKNYKNKDGSISLLKDENCEDCKGRGVVAERIESW